MTPAEKLAADTAAAKKHDEAVAAKQKHHDETERARLEGEKAKHKADQEAGEERKANAERHAADEKVATEEQKAKAAAAGNEALAGAAQSTLEQPAPGTISSPTAPQEPLLNATTKASNPESHAKQMQQPVDVDDAVNKAIATEQAKTGEAVKAAREEGAQDTYLSPNRGAPDPHTDAHSNALQAQQDQRQEETHATPGNAERSTAHDKLSSLVASYPDTAPNSHVVFGYGGVQVTLGDLRAVFG